MSSNSRINDKAKLKFGNRALVITEEFCTIKSDLKNERAFALMGKMKHRDKVPSIIPNTKKYNTKKMEIWIFKDYGGLK